MLRAANVREHRRGTPGVVRLLKQPQDLLVPRQRPSEVALMLRQRSEVVERGGDAVPVVQFAEQAQALLIPHRRLWEVARHEGNASEVSERGSEGALVAQLPTQRQALLEKSG